MVLEMKELVPKVELSIKGETNKMMVGKFS